MIAKLESGKQIKIEDSVIKNYCEKYSLTEAEAVQMYLEDEGYLDNAEEAELTAKAKVNKIDHEAYTTKEKKERKPRERKADPDKEQIIADLAQFLQENGANDVKIANIGKLIEFNFGESHYKLDLIRTRPPKNK